MIFRIIVEFQTEAEWNQGVDYYEARIPGVGARFNNLIFENLQKIALQPGRFPYIGRKAQKCKIIDWPYSIYFIVNEIHAEIKILAIWHEARNPDDLKRRLK